MVDEQSGSSRLKAGVFFFGGVEMPDVLEGRPIPAEERRYDKHAVWEATKAVLDLGVKAEEMGYDSYWLAEHHFQHEGYEVIPNSLQLEAYLAAKTTRITLGAMFNIVPQWHPLRLAEDFATLLNLSEGRAVLGVGRGTVPRETRSLAIHDVSVGHADGGEASRIRDNDNRQLFAEYMEVLRSALRDDRIKLKTDRFEYPPVLQPDEGPVDDLTLVPQPLYPVEIWQAVTSPPTVDYAAQHAHGCVWANQHYDFIRRQWDKYAELYEPVHGPLARGDKRILVLSGHIADSHEEAMATARPIHDAYWAFLGPYGWSRGYMGPDGRPVAPGHIPTLEQSIEQRTWAVGVAERVAEEVQFYRELLGLNHIVYFPQAPGLSYQQTEEQMERFINDVLPLVH